MSDITKKPGYLFPVSKHGQFVFSQGQDSKLETVLGKLLIDFGAGYGAASLGYGRNVASEAVANSALKLLHSCSCDFPNQPYIELAHLLHELSLPFIVSPGVYIGISGAEVVDATLKLLSLQKKDGHIIAFENSFHGRSLGAISVGSYHALGKSKYPSSPFPVHFLPFPSDHAEMINTIKLLEDFGASNDILSIFVEPILGEGGYIFPPDGFLHSLRAYADKKQCFLVFDEIQTGAGRTGSFFSFNKPSEAPDIVLLSKGIASGMPIAALIFSLEIFDVTCWDHAGTFSGNPLSCSAAVETINQISTQDFLLTVQERGRIILTNLKYMADEHHGLLMNPRGRGLMLAFDLNASNLFIEKFIQNALVGGLILLRTGISSVRISPPLTISENEIQLGCQIIKESLLATLNELSPHKQSLLRCISTAKELARHTNEFFSTDKLPTVSHNENQEKTVAQVLRSQHDCFVDWLLPFTTEAQTKILIETRFCIAPWTIIAIHGGDLEFRSDDLVRDLAGDEFAYHIFALKRKIWQEARKIGHVPSTVYEHPDLSRLLAFSSKLMSLHACQLEPNRLDTLHKSKLFHGTILVGGSNQPYLRKKLAVFLKGELKQQAPGILVLDKTEYEMLLPKLSGNKPENIVNRFGLPGIQLEIENDLLKSGDYLTIVNSLKKFLREN
jgi:4-aminobutyrate aminotransferase